MGNINWTEGEQAPEIDPEYPYQSAYIGLAEPKVHTFVAWPQAGNVFVKWTKNGEDYSTEPQITLLLDESADFLAVFAEDPDWQNPVMNFVGSHQCDRAHALVECFGADEAWITIEWGGSAREFDLTESARELDRMGECIYIEASVLKGTNTMADQLQMVYIIPAPEGCIVATVHCAVEAAEGFARRFNYMINTISAI